MSIIDRLKNIKDQLPKVALDEKVQKETDIKDQIKTEIKPEENINLGKGQVEDYILLNTFSAEFEKEDCPIKADQIFTIKKPEYDILNSNENQEIKISFTMVDCKHYLGKPTVYSNFKSDDEVVALIKEFNMNTPEWFQITEYGDDSNLPRLTTRYLGLKITKISFSEFSTLAEEGMMKYYTATMTYDRKVILGESN
jgi:hypothetical protein